MGLLSKVVEFLGIKNTKPLKEVADIVHGFADTKDEKRKFFKETLDKVLEDRQDARELYKKDNTLHKVYAIVFLCAYIGLTAWIIYAIIQGQFQTINQFESGLIGTIWGGMSAKVNTVTDFLFGSSDQNSEATKTLYEAETGKKLRHERKMARIEGKKN